MQHTTTPHTTPNSIDLRRHAPATLRNRQAIYDVLKGILPQEGLLLEIASGTGEHAAWLGPQFAPLIWQTSEYNQDLFPSIQAHIELGSAENIRPPLQIDVTREDWGLGLKNEQSLQNNVEAITCANMIHIAPWDAALGLFAGAAKFLKEGGVLFLYGPFFQQDIDPIPSNLEFDRSLRLKNSAWGIRRLEEVSEIAKSNGLTLDQIIPMPANNLSVVFRKRTSLTP